MKEQKKRKESFSLFYFYKQLIISSKDDGESKKRRHFSQISRYLSISACRYLILILTFHFQILKKIFFTSQLLLSLLGIRSMQHT